MTSHLTPRRERWLLLTLAGIQFTHILDFMIMMPLGPQFTRLFGISNAEFGVLVSAYTLSAGASGLLAATYVDRFSRKRLLQLPAVDGGLVIEGAGGLMVPLTRDWLTIDLFADWQLPVVLCARTALGTINHSLLSIEALRLRDIYIVGIAFIGEANEDSERTICTMGGVRRLGRLPHLPDLNAAALADAFRENFNLADFGVEL